MNGHGIRVDNLAMRVKTDEKREEILAVAAEVFRELGYQRASMATISARLGGSKSTLYGYFESKEELFVEVALAAGRREIGDALADLNLARSDVRAALLHFATRYVQFLTSERSATLHRMVIGEAGHSDIGQRFAAAGPRLAVLHIEAFMEEAMKAGLLARGDPERAAAQFLGLLHAEALLPTLYGLPPSKARQRAIVQEAVEILLTTFAPGG